MSNTYIQKMKKFIDKNYGWILLISGLFAFILVERGDFMADFIDGYNKGCKDCDDSEGFNGSMFFVLPFVLMIFGFVIYLVAETFYRIFFKYILQKGNTIYIIAFIVWLLFFYNLFWKLIYWLFNKNNAFVDKFSNVKSITSEDAVLVLIKNYRESDATTLTSISFLIIITYGLVKNYVANSHKQAQLITQKSQAELAALKAQINPHFLFNVLNNLYGTAIVEESPKTSEGILQLSSIMRHVVEGTKNEKIELEKEVRFMNDYLDLSKMRIPNRPNIRIETKIDIDEIPTMVAPLLVIPYLENAFKYGISMNEECFIEMSYVVKNQQLEFFCRNSIIKTNDTLEMGTGTGLENTKRRLDLYYPDGYQLNINSSEGIFVVNLNIQL
jgi:hypothetical protein